MQTKIFNVTNEFGVRFENLLFQKEQGGWLGITPNGEELFINEALTLGCYNPVEEEGNHFSANWFGVVCGEVK